MRILVLGAGGVGSAVAAIARRRSFFERMVVADLDAARAHAAVERHGDPRLTAIGLDASDEQAVADVARAEGADAILNACDPRLNLPIFRAAFVAGCTYLDMAMTLSRPHPELDRKEPIDVRGTRVAPRDVVAASLPDPARLGDRMTGRTCAGTLVTGTGHGGAPRAVYLHHIADNEQTMREDGVQAVVWQTAINPVVALELLATGTWSGAGVPGPEAFDAAPFLALLADYGSPHGMEERDPADPLRR